MCKHCTVRREALDRLYRFSRDAQTDRRRTFTLTDAEREAIVQAIGLADWHKAYFSHLKQGEPLPSATLRGLLERLK